jgi:hypothetical protein
VWRFTSSQIERRVYQALIKGVSRECTEDGGRCGRNKVTVSGVKVVFFHARAIAAFALATSSDANSCLTAGLF